jgi:hypothetical protein
MNREEFDRIANEELDGVAGPEAKAALRAYVDRDAEARDRYRDWKELFDSLDAAGLEDAPPHLVSSVMRAVVAQRRADVPVRRLAGWTEAIWSLVQVPAWRSALTFASGVGVGAAAIALVAGTLVGGGRIEPSVLSGTMLPHGAGRSGSAVEVRTLELDGMLVSVSARRTAEGLVLRVEANDVAAKGSELLATYDGVALRSTALRIDPPTAGEVEVGPNRIRIGLEGAGAFTLSLHTEEAPTAPLHVELRSGARSSRTTLRTDSFESR